MAKRKIDLSDIKEYDLDKTSSFTDLMTKKEIRNRHVSDDDDVDIEDMIKEKKKSNLTKNYDKEIENTRNDIDIKKEIKELNNIDNTSSIETTQIFELDKKIKLNSENSNKSSHTMLLNIVGITNLFCIFYYLYSFMFTNSYNNKYLIVSGLIILLVFIFCISIVANKRLRKILNILNVLLILIFIIFNVLLII